MDALILASKPQIAALCKELGVRSLFAFGSATRGDFRPDSDIDLLVDLQADGPLQYSDRYFALKDQLQALLHRSIDLVESKAVKNPYFRQELDRTKELVYGQ